MLDLCLIVDPKILKKHHLLLKVIDIKYLGPCFLSFGDTNSGLTPVYLVYAWHFTCITYGLLVLVLAVIPIQY